MRFPPPPKKNIVWHVKFDSTITDFCYVVFRPMKLLTIILPHMRVTGFHCFVQCLGNPALEGAGPAIAGFLRFTTRYWISTHCASTTPNTQNCRSIVVPFLVPQLVAYVAKTLSNKLFKCRYILLVQIDSLDPCNIFKKLKHDC